VPVLVEDAVVRQVVLGVTGHHAPVPQDRRGVGGTAQRGGAQVAEDHREVAVAVRVDRRCQGAEFRSNGALEGATQGEVLDGVPGEGHLGERHEVRAGLGGPGAGRADEGGVPGEVAHAGVHLGQGQSQRRHGASLFAAPGGRRRPACSVRSSGSAPPRRAEARSCGRVLRERRCEPP